LFLKCKEVKSIWNELKLEKERAELCLCQDAKAVVLNCEKEKGVLIACLLWRWWTRRNKINAKESGGSKESLLSQVKFWAGEAEQYCKRQRQITTVSTAEKAWQAPVGDTMKNQRGYGVL
jgi:hypothetical protein